MKRTSFSARVSVFLALLFMLSMCVFRQASATEKLETDAGFRVVHNKKGGEWGNSPRVSIELIRTIGDIAADDEQLAFDEPVDMAFDGAGNIYILDSRNNRIQKFNADAKYLATFGRRGQGPAEFNYPQTIDVDSQGLIYVLDGYQKRIQVLTPTGKEQKTIPIVKHVLDRMRLLNLRELVVKGPLVGPYSLSGSGGKTLPKLVKVLDLEGNLVREFADAKDYGDETTDSLGNIFDFWTDALGNVYLAFIFQNRIEKYSADGVLLWRADRELNYPTVVMPRPIKGASGLSLPAPNRCSAAVASDEKGWVWVATYNRQIKKEEDVFIIGSIGKGGGGAFMSRPVGSTGLQTTDMYKLEIYNLDGVLLGEIPLTQFVDKMFIHKDRLFLLDSVRGEKFYEYRIKET